MAMKYSGSEKGMMVYGFVPQDEITLEYWTGSGSRVIVPETIVKIPFIFKMNYNFFVYDAIYNISLFTQLLSNVTCRMMP